MLDPVEFGKAMASIVKDAVAPLAAENAALRERVEQLEARQPEKGEKGDPGEPGKDAPPVEIDVADVVKQLLAEDAIKQIVGLEVESFLTENPPAPGKDGERGEKGETGEKGADGKDGAGIADLLIDRDGNLTATFTDGRMKSLGVVVGKDGPAGKDGADFSDCQIEYDGERTITIKGNGGEIIKRLPIPMDKGYWNHGAHEKGDIVTHDGIAWIALRDTKAKPATDAKEDWRIFARKGRDGRDGKDGKAPGPVRLKDGD